MTKVRKRVTRNPTDEILDPKNLPNVLKAYRAWKRTRPPNAQPQIDEDYYDRLRRTDPQGWREEWTTSHLLGAGLETKNGIRVAWKKILPTDRARLVIVLGKKTRPQDIKNAWPEIRRWRALAYKRMEKYGIEEETEAGREYQALYYSRLSYAEIARRYNGYFDTAVRSVVFDDTIEARSYARSLLLLFCAPKKAEATLKDAIPQARQGNSIVHDDCPFDKEMVHNRLSYWARIRKAGQRRVKK